MRGAADLPEDRVADPGRDPSPVTVRLVKAPNRDTLSPKERAMNHNLVTLSPKGEGNEPHSGHPLPKGEGS